MEFNYRVEISAEGYETTDFKEYFVAMEYYEIKRESCGALARR